MAMSKRNISKFRLDTENPPPVTAAQRRRLAAIAALPDSKIDYSDIPKSGAHVKWSRPGALVPAGNKLQVTLRLDADVLSFFKKTGERYQTRINAVLREYMQAHRNGV
jgi:uncharacterized protein (DUF4415 family)